MIKTNYSGMPTNQLLPCTQNTLKYSQAVKSNKKCNLFKSLGALIVCLPEKIINALNTLKTFITYLWNLLARTTNNDNNTILLNRNYSLLRDAIDKGCVKGVRDSLAKQCIDLGATDKNGKTVLDYLYEQANSPTIEKIADALYEHSKNNINVRDAKGKTALMYAAEKGCSSILRSQMKIAGIKIDLKDNDGKTALDYAKQNNNEDCAKILKGLATSEDSKITVESLKDTVPDDLVDNNDQITTCDLVKVLRSRHSLKQKYSEHTDIQEKLHKEKLDQLEAPLSKDEKAILHDWTVNTKNFYKPGTIGAHYDSKDKDKISDTEVRQNNFNLGNALDKIPAFHADRDIWSAKVVQLDDKSDFPFREGDHLHTSVPFAATSDSLQLYLFVDKYLIPKLKDVDSSCLIVYKTKGCNGKPISDFSMHMEECEVLIRPGTSFIITNIELRDKQGDIPSTAVVTLERNNDLLVRDSIIFDQYGKPLTVAEIDDANNTSNNKAPKDEVLKDEVLSAVAW